MRFNGSTADLLRQLWGRQPADGDLGLRPIYHQRADRIEAHLFVAFLAYRFINHTSPDPRWPSAFEPPRVPASG